MENTRPKTLLLVEDETIIAMAEARILEKHGYQVVITSSGEQAIEMVAANPAIDLILMDIDLGRGIDGTQAAQKILQQRDLPIIFLTAHTEQAMVEKVRKITRYGYVLKDSGNFVLLSSIEMAFELFEAHQQIKQSEARIRMKLNAILAPDGDLETLELEDIVDMQAIQALMNDFYALTRIGVAILDIHGKVLVATGWQDICTQFHRVHPETRKHCLESDTELSEGVAPGTFKIYRCKNNMWDMVTPIMVGGKHLGNLFLGQFLFEHEVPDEALFRSQAQRYGFDEEEYLFALRRVPRWSRETINTVMTFYTGFANLVSALSHANLKLARMLAERESLLALLRESEANLSALIENTDHCIWSVDLHYCLIIGNSWFRKGMQTVLGYEPAKGEYLLPKAIPQSTREEWQEYYDRVLHGEAFSVETATRFSGEPCQFEYRLHPIRNSTGMISGVTVSGHDITERKRAEKQIQQLLTEKELLLREVHHRIKNNMSMLISLLDLHTVTLHNQDAKTELHDASNRMRSMVEIYDKLYRSHDYTTINLKHYLTDLLYEITRTYPQMHKVIVEHDIVDLMIDQKYAFPIGIIINELITNALKYAFPERRSGTISICVHQMSDQSVKLVVADNGVGIPADIDLTRTQSFGLHLISLLVEQYDGQIQLDHENGTQFTITFPEILSARKHQT
ncbi:hypothetical sensory transduction histidine kinase [Candidatus Vecturithrix granuli]|uniref:Hypothetical sensory transduction histidine kinase n=1 Tax=Vecturithrix granuli TaxID=1499967 RepID=A0A0S6W6A0_VECG1|nr:hypothetical sensory transduction histidine kinase [Candidatus Vecturithrix granuli]